MKAIYFTFLLLLLTLLSIGADHSVHILSENLEQYVTSTTLEWVPSSANDDEILLTNAVIAGYQFVEEPIQNEPIEDDMQEISVGLVERPVYVCRAKINSVWVSGQLRPKKTVCVVSLYGKVSEYKQFDILISIEGSARLSWVHKNKYTLISQGAVTTGDNILKSYIARRPAKSHNKEGSLTYVIGMFTPSENLGVFYLVDQNNNELHYEDGEILVETEPMSYEFNSIKLERFRGRFPKIKKQLGETVLKNEEDTLQHVARVVSYKYNYYLFWGKGHGLLTGLPFTVTLTNGTVIEGSWALPKEEEKSDVAPVERYLEPGTAVNVTIIGNYTESEIPYNATVVAIYKDGEKREITIRDTKRENKILDVVAVYGPVYYLHNNSHVPTTTTTTIASTSGIAITTHKTTSTTQNVVQPAVTTTPKIADKSQDNANMLSDQNTDGHNSSTKPNGTPKEPSSASSMGLFTLVTIFIVSLVISRVT